MKLKVCNGCVIELHAPASELVDGICCGDRTGCNKTNRLIVLIHFL